MRWIKETDSSSERQITCLLRWCAVVERCSAGWRWHVTAGTTPGGPKPAAWSSFITTCEAAREEAEEALLIRFDAEVERLQRSGSAQAIPLDDAPTFAQPWIVI